MKFVDGVLSTADGFKFDLKKAFQYNWNAPGSEAFRHSFEPGDSGGFQVWFPGQYLAVISERAYRDAMKIPVNFRSPNEWQKSFRDIGKYVESKYKEWVE